MTPLLDALRFLTRLPVPGPAAPPDARALPYYPLVGAAIGVTLATVLVAMAGAAVPLRAVTVLIVWVCITGALHLDGLADAADGWVGGLGDRTRTLEIMRDPRSGPAGVVALTLVLLLKFAALQAVPPAAWPALLAVPALARATLPMLFISTPYVRVDGLGAALAGISRRAVGATTAATVLFLVLAVGVHAWLLLTVATGVFVGVRAMLMARLDGTTGDTAGALVELVEVALLFVLALQG